jgi:hypothetical protein
MGSFANFSVAWFIMSLEALFFAGIVGFMSELRNGK